MFISISYVCVFVQYHQVTMSAYANSGCVNRPLSDFQEAISVLF